MATKAEIEGALAETNTKLDNLAGDVATEAGEIKALIDTLSGQVSGGANSDQILEGIKGIGARVDGLRANVAALVTPTPTEPTEPVSPLDETDEEP